LTAILAALAVVVATATLIWFVRPNRDSGSTPSDTPVTAPATVAPTSVAPASVAPTTVTPSVEPTTAPASPSTP
jgi:hypothetical protein